MGPRGLGGTGLGLAFDASSLIILQEAGLLPEVCRLGLDLVATEEVLREVHSPAVHSLVRSGELKAVRASTAAVPPELRLGLGEGETSILGFVSENRSYWAVLDEKPARLAARTLGIRFLGTARLIKHLADKEILSIDRVRTILESLPRIGFYIDPETVREVLEEKPLDL